MTRRSKRLSLLICAVIAPRLCLAGGWGNPVTITGYYVYANGAAFFTTSGNQNPDNCSNDGYLVLDESQPNFKELYATLMTAQATGSTVSLDYEGCSGGSTAEYPLVDAIAVPNRW